MDREAVILAGGLGTRLRGVIGDIPKPMAPVSGLPFLAYILEQLLKASFSRAIIAAGYRYESIVSYFGDNYKGIELEYSVEHEPLGTGGALLKASSLIISDHFFVFNGDSVFCINLEDFEKFFSTVRSDMAIALKPMKDFDRYGSVTLEKGRIVSFNEKRRCSEGLINGGIYIVNRQWFEKNCPGKKFSFEKDLMEKRTGNDSLNGYISESYFIDIGIPEDYDRAQTELPQIFSLIR